MPYSRIVAPVELLWYILLKLLAILSELKYVYLSSVTWNDAEAFASCTSKAVVDEVVPVPLTLI
jgi:hypothetical protein